LKIRDNLRSMTGISDQAPIEEVIARAYQLLAQAPSVIVTATLEDALAVQERPNIPAPNALSWCLALPQSREHLQSSSLARAIAESLRNR
jgi:4-alpha-glucanotransferase